MPFLRGSDGAAHELRSSKTLIGASPSKCDVVVKHTGVLDLHALLNLSTDKSSGNLVPFSAQTSGGICYLNDRVVPIEGAPVVHGDRIAFGDPGTSFTFELTSSSPPQRPNPYTNTSHNSTASFRRALDALRGDRTASPRGSMASKRTPTQKKPNSSRNQSNASLSGSFSASKSQSKLSEQLGRFLLDAPSDSLLSDFVERKLRQSSNRNKKTKKRVTPMAMEPPPSLSASSASFASSSASMRSALEDSILNRTSNLAKSNSASTTMLGNSRGAIGGASSRMSTAERNYAEIEKLRLSQQLREVNSILNGQTEFSASYLALSNGKPVRTRSQEHQDQDQDRALRQSSQSVFENEDEDDEGDEDDEDELPVMVEKKPQPVISSTVAVVAPVLNPEPPAATANDQDDEEEEDEESTNLNESLPSFSEPVRLLQPNKTSQNNSKPRPADAMIQSLRASKSNLPVELSESKAPSPPTVAGVKPSRTALHQQLIDQTLRHKRQEILSQGFVRWRRGLRIQSQNRQQRAQQFHRLRVKLVLLRRNRLFFQWKALAEVNSQVLSCRVDAFQERVARRMLMNLWTQWRLKHFSQFQRRCQLLQSVIARVLMKSKQRAFCKWQISSNSLQDHAKMSATEHQNQQKWELKSQKVAELHHIKRLVNPMLGRVLRSWNAFTKLQMKKLYVLRKLTLRGALKLKQRGWRQWKQVMLLSRHVDAAQREHKAQLEEILTQQSDQQQKQHMVIEEAHSKELHDLQKQLEGKQKELLELQQWEKAKDKELHKLRQLQNDSEQRKVTQKQEWTQSLESYFENAVKRCDRQISQANKDLEQILQLAEEDVSGARFVAARVLVETMLEQKVHNSNERIEVQETLLVHLTSMSQQRQRELQNVLSPAIVSLQGDTGIKQQALSNNAKFLHDMAQQRLIRLHQLLGAIAKLAAAAQDDDPQQQQQQQQQQFDPVKLRHSTFLTDAILQRQQRHINEMTAILFKLSHYTSSRRVDGGDIPPATTA